MGAQTKRYVKQVFPIQCLGRDFKGNNVLAEPIEVKIKIHKSSGSNTISSEVRCSHNLGAHGQQCKASHQFIDKPRNEVACPYSFDIPHALERNR